MVHDVTPVSTAAFERLGQDDCYEFKNQPKFLEILSCIARLCFNREKAVGRKEDMEEKRGDVSREETEVGWCCVYT